MNRTRLWPLLAAFSLLASPAFAQTDIDTTAPADPADSAIRDILATGPGDLDIAADKRADLSGCDGVDAAGVLRAIHSCWPVLETYRDYTPLIAAMNGWMDLAPARQELATPQSEAATAAADRIIARTPKRLHPAQDVPLMIAHLSRAHIGRAQGDLDTFIAHVTTAREILATSRITAKGFTGGGDDLDRQLAEAKAELAERKK